MEGAGGTDTRQQAVLQSVAAARREAEESRINLAQRQAEESAREHSRRIRIEAQQVVGWACEHMLMRLGLAGGRLGMRAHADEIGIGR